MRDPHIDKLIQDLKAKKFQEGEGKRLTDTFGENLKGQFGPAIKEAIKEGLAGITMPKMPDMPKIPEYKQQEIPQPVVNVEAPIVNVPAPVVHVPAPVINIPETKYPDFPEFPSEIGLRAGNKPFPVIMMDQGGKPMVFPFPASAGPSFPMQVLDQTNNALRVSGSFSVTSSNASTQLIDSSLNAIGTAANPLNVAVSGSAGTTAVVGDGAPNATDPDNSYPVKVGGKFNTTLPTLTDGQRGDLQLSSTGAAYIVHAARTSPADATSNTNATATIGNRTNASTALGFEVFPMALNSAGAWDRQRNNTGTADTALRVVHASDVGVSVTVSGFTASISSVPYNNEGIAYNSDNPLPVTFAGSSSTSMSLVNADGAYYNSAQGLPVTLQTALDGTIDSISTYQASGANFSVSVTGATGTLAASIVDSSGVQYSGSNPLPVTFSAASSQNVNLFDAQASTITSHQQVNNPDFRGVDTNLIGIYNVSSVLNSSAAVLGVGGEFTGGIEDVKNYGSLTYYVFSDVGSSTNGFQVQQSGDGSNFDVTDSYTIPAGTGKVFSVQPAAQYVRIFYANGASGQTAFRLYQTNHYISAQPSSQRSQDGYTNETDLQQMWGFLSAFNGSTWDRLSVNTGAAATALRVVQAADAVSSTSITSIVGPIAQGDSASALRVVIAGDVASSVVVNSGTITTVTSVTNSIAAATIDSSGVQYSGSNPFPYTLVTNATATMNVALTDSGGVQYSGSNPVPVTLVTSVTQNTNLVGGGNDSIFTYMARTTNPTAVADGADVRPKADKLGRPVMRPIQVRDLIATAYVSVSTGTETTLLTAGAATFLDLIMITATNNSSAATQLDIRNTSAGNIVHTMYLPASTGPIGFTPPVPWPQDATGNAWTIDLPDITGTTVYVSALFSKEI